ncbi:hypothetical protein HZH68_000576 [Vespula germanica]|uniref:Uncharacterized protein n=2 Tax=Vespula TaxID=7451 RepID=A0A834NTV9_VESGE|nr:hypothetical protein HZH68_000576 [Vespula germanica]KAF7438209.1 hypothetical protein H0235_000600 [Vespula pensylvanica]
MNEKKNNTHTKVPENDDAPNEMDIETYLYLGENGKDQVHACKQSQLTKARTLVLDDSRTMPVGLGRFVDTKMSIARRLRPCKRASRSGSWICGIDGPEACREESAGIER